MSLSIMTSQGEINVPTHSGGGVNLELLNRIEELENKVKQLTDRISTKADRSNYGMTKISDSSDVTEVTGFSLPSREKNPTLEGTMANKMERIKESISVRNIVFSNINTEHLEGNYSNGYKIGSIAIVNIDVYFKDILQSQKFKLLDIDCSPDKTTFSRGIGTNNKYCDFELDDSGTIFVVTGLNNGNFNIRSQIVFKTKQ